MLNFLLNSKHREHTVVMICTAIGLILYIAVWIYLYFKKEKSWWNEHPENINTTNDTKVPFTYNPRISSIVFIILLLTFLGVNIWDFFGRYNAEHQKEFNAFVLPPSNSEVAVIRSYGDYLYAVPFNRATKEFEKKLVIIKMSESAKPSLTLSLEMIGPLKEMSSENEQ
jgi:hypothetical protein